VRRLHITLELISSSEPIRGTVSGETAPRSFTGWMQLITVLQAAIQESETDPGKSGSGADTGTYLNHTPED
jgi:hypothetical protein